MFIHHKVLEYMNFHIMKNAFALPILYICK
jgi:hypothetical protein